MMHLPRRLLAVGLAALCSLAFAGAAQATTSYSGLGDSYSAGSGAGTSDLSASCYRSTKGYPYVVAQQRTDLALSFVACGGAKTSDVINNQVPTLSTATGLITITIGGNDVGFVNLILACNSGSYAWCESQISSTNDQIKNQLPAKLDSTYSAIAGAAPGARTLVLGYPRLFSGKTCAQSGNISSTEEKDLNGVADNLDAVIKDRAAAHGFTYLDATGPFGGHDVCSSTPWLWGVNNPYGSTYQFHPNATGQASGYAAMVRSVIG